MANERISIHGIWTSRWVFILAATGSAVGLGNIWKFPYMAGVYGGGAFVLVYLLCIALIGVPIMLAETVLGRRGRQSPVNTLRSLALQAGASARWSWVAIMGMVAALLILSFYSVVAGWSLDYIIGMGRGEFVGIDGDSAGARFGGLTADPWRLTLWHSLFMLVTGIIIARGVVAGLEKSLRIMMPLLFVLLIVLLGSYMPKKSSIGGTVMPVALLDTVVALTAGMALFPIVFAAGLEPTGGPGLMFVTLPIAFGNIALGQVFGLLFFVLVAMAAWSSAISMLEPAVAYWVERTGRTRTQITAAIALVCWIVGLGTVLSFNVLADARFFVTDESGWSLFKWTTEGGKTLFESIDYLTSRIMLPLGGLLFAVFAGWILGREVFRAELALRHPRLFPVVYWLLRYVAPVGVLIVFVTELLK